MRRKYSDRHSNRHSNRYADWYVFGLLGVVVLGLGGCSGQPAARPANAAQPTVDVTDYALTQGSASQPDRGNCRDSKQCAGQATAPPAPVVPSCDAEDCEGELPQAAIAELRQTAAGLQDCYEKELRRFEREKLDTKPLEGRVQFLLRLAATQPVCSAKVERGDFELSEGFTACAMGRLKATLARPISGCVDIALPVVFVKKEVDKLPEDQAAPERGSSQNASSPATPAKQ